MFCFNDTATTEIYTLSLHDALPILTWYSRQPAAAPRSARSMPGGGGSPSSGSKRTTARPGCSPTSTRRRSEEHTSELQSHSDLVCRLLLEKKNNSQTSIEASMNT